MGDDSSQETQVPNGKSNHLLYRTAKNRADFFCFEGKFFDLDWLADHSKISFFIQKGYILYF